MVDIQWPYGPANTETILATGLTQAFVISDQMTIITSETMTAGLTLSISTEAWVKPGAQILLVVTSGSATQSINFTGSIIAPAITNTNLKTVTQGFIYSGTNFYPMGAKIQVN